MRIRDKEGVGRRARYALSQSMGGTIWLDGARSEHHALRKDDLSTLKIGCLNYRLFE